MKNINGMTKSLNKYLGWNKARITCFIQMLLGLIAVRSVNLHEIALAMGGKTKIDSRYRKLQRFFSLFEIDFTVIARWLFKLFINPGKKFYLVIDRTNWYWGKHKINIFMLGVAHEGMVIPLFWHLLPKAGSSNFKEQKALLSCFIDTFGINGIEGLLADREFASGKLFKWLNQNAIPFYIRIKEGAVTCIRSKKFLTAKKIFNDLQPNTKKEFGMTVWVFGQKVFLAGSRSERGELMIVATNQKPKTAIATYLRRWEIENLFQSLKGRGFRFEETHITHLDRIAKLIVLLAVGFAWAHKIGEWKALKKPIIWKKFRGQSRPQYSYFRYGLDFIREAILHIWNKFNKLNQFFSHILPPMEAVA